MPDGYLLNNVDAEFRHSRSLMLVAVKPSRLRCENYSSQTFRKYGRVKKAKSNDIKSSFTTSRF